MCKKAKVTVKRAAEILGKSQQFVRIGYLTIWSSYADAR